MRALILVVLLLSATALYAAGRIDVNDAITDAGTAFTAAYVVDGQPGGRSVFLIWNRADATKAVYIDRITLAHSSGDANNPEGCDIRRTTVKVGAYRGRGLNKAVYGPNSGAEFYTGNPAANDLPTPGTDIIFECWPGDRFNDKDYAFVPPIKLPPGTGVYIASAQNDNELIVSVQFREKLLP